MKKYFIIAFIWVLSLPIFGQNNTGTHSISVELIPLAQQFTGGTGFHVNYQFEKNRFNHHFSVGYFYTGFKGFHDAEYSNALLDEKDAWTTSIDYEINENFPFYGNNHENLEKQGIIVFKPDYSYKLNRFISYELLYKAIDNKFSFYGGIGLTAGLTNMSNAFYFLDGKITGSNYEVDNDAIRIVMYARSKYIYFAPTLKVVFDYQISDKFNLGISGGMHSILDENFEPNYPYYYMGLMAKFKVF